MRHFSQKPRGLASKLSGCWLLLGQGQSLPSIVCSLGESLFKASFFEEAVYEMCGGVKCIVQIFSKLWSKGPNGIVWTWDVMCLLTIVFLSVKTIQK